jgi:hypothetical protein
VGEACGPRGKTVPLTTLLEVAETEQRTSTLPEADVVGIGRAVCEVLPGG